MQLEQLRIQYRDAILQLADKYHAENVRVFGSLARGQHQPDSDIDLLVHFKRGASLLDEAGLKRELGALIGYEIDVIGDDVIREEFHPFIMQDALPL